MGIWIFFILLITWKNKIKTENKIFKSVEYLLFWKQQNQISTNLLNQTLNKFYPHENFYLHGISYFVTKHRGWEWFVLKQTLLDLIRKLNLTSTAFSWLFHCKPLPVKLLFFLTLLPKLHKLQTTSVIYMVWLVHVHVFAFNSIVIMQKSFCIVPVSIYTWKDSQKMSPAHKFLRPNYACSYFWLLGHCLFWGWLNENDMNHYLSWIGPLL